MSGIREIAAENIRGSSVMASPGALQQTEGEGRPVDILHISDVILLTSSLDLIRMQKSLYLSSTTSSRKRSNTHTCRFLPPPRQEDDDQSLDDQSLDDQSLNDQSIGSVLEDITRVTEAGRLQVLHLVFVATRRVTVPSVNASLSFCLIQPKDDYIEFREVLTFGDPPGPPAEDVVATWRPEGHGGRGGRRTREVPLPYRGDAVVPQDFRGNVVRVTAIEAAPYTIVSWTSSGEMQVKGYLVDLLGILQQQLNFTVKWIPTADNQFGVPESDGTWTGMVGQLHRQVRVCCRICSHFFTCLHHNDIKLPPSSTITISKPQTNTNKYLEVFTSGSPEFQIYSLWSSLNFTYSQYCSYNVTDSVMVIEVLALRETG
ncbi:uncharacterized protein LOC122263590, partial [Penaeus japonicus]|uniref:uncharacterized protein LOC122263590 n=1 Tax=Penaeus japonicus TaxID=27405 RepID=UPI001C7136BC